MGLSADRRTLQVATTGGRFILKPATEIFPRLPESEHLTMRLGAHSGLEIAGGGLIEVDGRWAYLTRRFDRRENGTKVRQEDFCQLAEKRPGDKYAGSGELCARIVKKFATDPILELLKMFQQMLFSWWVGNGDLHMKNLSLFVDELNTIRLTPAYDLVATRLLIPNDRLALPICGRDEKLQRSTWQKFARYCNLPDRIFNAAIARQIDALPGALALVAHSRLPVFLQAQLSEQLTRHTSILKNADLQEDSNLDA